MFGWFKRRRAESKLYHEAQAQAHRDRARAIEQKEARHRDDFDADGFALGMMTGIPLSPTHGFSTGAMLGAALHHRDEAPAEAPAASAIEAGGGSFGGGGSSSSWDSPSSPDSGSSSSSD